GDFLDRGLPGLEDLLAPVGVAADADDATAMIEADARFRKGARKVDEFVELGEEQPGIEAQAERRKLRKALAERRIEQEALRPRRIDAADAFVGIPGRGMADAAETAVAGGDLRFQHRLG